MSRGERFNGGEVRSGWSTGFHRRQLIACSASDALHACSADVVHGYDLKLVSTDLDTDLNGVDSTLHRTARQRMRIPADHGRLSFFPGCGTER
jgi:hypothetical protein